MSPKPFDAETCRAQFPILAEPPGGLPLHYLDNAATAQLPSAVLTAVRRHETMARANVMRGVHHLAEAATWAYEDARQAVADYLGVADPGEVIFTSGTTASINLVAYSFGESLGPGDEVLVSELEHHSNLVPWQMLARRRGVTLKVLPVTDEGRLDLAKLPGLLSRKTKLLALTHCSNVTGAVTEVGPVVEAAKSVGARVLLDGAQRVPHGPLDLPALGVDFYAFSGHKLYAPNGVGVLWGKRACLDAMPPFMGGGGMIQRVSLTEDTTYAEIPRRFEAGTPPIAQAVGLGAAVRWAKALDWAGIAQHEARLTGRILDGLGHIKDCRVIGPTGLQGRLGVISFAIDGVHPHDICQWLDRHGVALRGGHHCAQPLAERFGLAGTTRASLAPYNTDGDVDAFLTGLDDALGHLR
ncbi:MAG: aminotransferase class V-fold PLP-dependent enzyme [Pseudomonadota bacterium]